MRGLVSLQAKLIAAFSVVVVVALVLSAGVFIFVRRDNQRQQELDRVAAASPAILGEWLQYSFQGQPNQAYAEFVNLESQRHDVRVLLVGPDGAIIADSGRNLAGKALDVPPLPPTRREGALSVRSYVTWEPGGNSPGSGYVLLASNLPSFPLPSGAPRIGTRGNDGLRLVLGVPQSTIANAWLSLLPGLVIAAAIALPVAILLALLLARYVTRPLHQLRLATEKLAEGTFEVDVPTGRRDEVGALAQSFDTMARRVGATQAQMRSLVANVSHDLKTPLTSILGFSRALSTGAASGADTQRVGGIIHDEAKRLSARLDDLLLLSELDSGKAVIEPDELDLGRLARSVVERLLPVGQPRRYALEIDLPPGVAVSGDPSKLERVIENLIDNARKFTPDGGQLLVRAAADARLRRAVLKVGNTYDALPQEEIDQLFDRFVRGDRSRTAPGTGLGLSIARDIATLHHGSLTAAMESGRLVFTLALPWASTGEPVPRPALSWN